MHKTALLHFKHFDPVLFKVIKDPKNYNISKSTNHFERLSRIIVGQQLSVHAARSIWERYKNLHPRKRITPDDTVNLPYNSMRSVGLSNGKVKSLQDLTNKILEERVVLKNISKKSNEEIHEILEQVHGIGPWSVEMFLMSGLGREDIFSHGDLGLRKGIQKLYEMKSLPSDRTIVRVTNKWKPYRTYAALVLWNHLDNNPD